MYAFGKRVTFIGNKTYWKNMYEIKRETLMEGRITIVDLSVKITHFLLRYSV